MQDLGTLGGTNSQADAINNTGQIVGWANTFSGDQHAFVWSAGKMVDLNGIASVGPAAALVEATGINDTGQVVANGDNGRAYVFTVPPQLPGTIALSTPGTVDLGQSVAFPTSLSAPAPVGGVTLTLASGDTSKLTVTPSSVTIPGGSLTPAAVPQVTGVSLGTATISVSAPSYVTVYQQMRVTEVVYSQTSYDPLNLDICMVNPISGANLGMCDAFTDWNQPTGNPPGKLSSITVKLRVQTDAEYNAWDCYWSGGSGCGSPGDFGYINVYSSQINQACTSTNQPMLMNYPRDTWQDFTFKFDASCAIDFSQGNQLWDIARANGSPYGWGMAFSTDGKPYAIIRSR